MVLKEVKRERNLTQLQAVKSFSRFSSEENLLFGLRLSSISLNIVQELVKRIISDEKNN